MRQRGNRAVETVYDWGSMIVFAGLVVLFLQRSQGEARDQLWQYLVAAVGCAVTNQIGNAALKNSDMIYHAGAIALGAVTLAFIYFVLKPFDELGSS